MRVARRGVHSKTLAQACPLSHRKRVLITQTPYSYSYSYCYSYSYSCWSRLLASAQLPKATADGVRPFLQVAATGVHPDEFSLQSAVRRRRHLYFLQRYTFWKRPLVTHSQHQTSSRGGVRSKVGLPNGSTTASRSEDGRSPSLTKELGRRCTDSSRHALTWMAKQVTV